MLGNLSFQCPRMARAAKAASRRALLSACNTQEITPHIQALAAAIRSTVVKYDRVGVLEHLTRGNRLSLATGGFSNTPNNSHPATYSDIYTGRISSTFTSISISTRHPNFRTCPKAQMFSFDRRPISTPYRHLNFFVAEQFHTSAFLSPNSRA